MFTKIVTVSTSSSWLSLAVKLIVYVPACSYVGVQVNVSLAKVAPLGRLAAVIETLSPSGSDAKMANVLQVDKEMSLIREGKRKRDKETTVSYDEKPGIQATKNIAPQLPPVVNKYKVIMRDYEYKRLGTLSLLAGIDLHTGKVIPYVSNRHRSKEFIEFLEILDNEYPDDWKLRIILDNHSAHVSKETKEYLLNMPGRFELVFTPNHGSWLNMIEVFFSKISMSCLNKIRV